MEIRLTKISPTHHSFEYTRDTGVGEKVTLETKTFLFHDFLHFAVEKEAGLKNSFYGLLMHKKTYTELTPQKGGGRSEKMETFFQGEVGLTERVVGALTGVIKGDATPEEFFDGIKNMFDAYHEEVPAWLTHDFVRKVKERMRQLLGEWNKTPLNTAMTLEF